MRRIFLLVFSLACGCATLAGGARREFSKTYTCPADRITVVDGGPQPHEWTTTEVPPDEVKDDPDRLAFWNEQHAKAARDTDDRWDVFTVDGCGHHQVYRCRHPYIAGAEQMSSYDCEAKPTEENFDPMTVVDETHPGASHDPAFLRALAANLEESAATAEKQGDTAMATKLRDAAKRLRLAADEQK